MYQAHQAYKNGDRESCQKICLQILLEPWLALYLLVDTCFLLSHTVDFSGAEFYLKTALSYLDQGKSIQETEIIHKMQDRASKMLVELDEQRLADELRNDIKGQRKPLEYTKLVADTN